MNIETLIQQFESAILPKDEWHHLAHLRVALYYNLKQVTKYDALIKMRCSLIRYGALRNPSIVCVDRYNETITTFWIFTLDRFIKRNPDKSFEELEDILMKSELISKDYILKFYSRDLLDSKKAKATYVAPKNN